MDMLLYKVKEIGDFMKKSSMDILNQNMFKLELFKKIDIKAEKTDFVTLLGNTGDYVIRMKRSNRDDLVTILSNGHISNSNTYRMGIRPTILFTKITDHLISRYINEDGLLEVEYGYYPQTVMDLKEFEVEKNLLKQTGNYYGINPYERFYEYDSPLGRCIKYQVPQDKCIFECLSTSEIVEPGMTYYVKVEPIKWVVDKKTGLAISKKIIAYSDTIERFLSLFAQEIIMVEPKKNSMKTNEVSTYSNTKTDEVSELIKEISEYSKYYHGKIDIDGKIDHLINAYNNDINGLLMDKNNILTFKSKDKDFLYSKLIASLNDILIGLKINYENNKIYHDILKLIDNCLLIIDNKDSEANNNLEKDISTISNIIIPYLNDKKYKMMLKEIFTKPKEEIINILESMNELNSKIENKYESVEDFELTIRKYLQEYLISIYGEIINKDILNDIISNYKSIINNNYHETKCTISKVYLDSINELKQYIRENGTKEDILAMKKILIDVDDDNLDNITKQLSLIIQQLYIITLDIDERFNNQMMLSKYKIDLKKVRKEQTNC